MLLLLSQWMEALNIRHEIRAVSLDISRAFDAVWHPALLSKLFADGIQNQLHTLISLTLVAHVWHLMECFHLLSLERLACPKAGDLAVFQAQSNS